MSVRFYSPNGDTWETTPNVDDRSKMLSMPVRTYFDEEADFTILACVKFSVPDQIYYDLKIRRPHGVEFPQSAEEDIKIFHGLLEGNPISICRYDQVENKIREKIAKLKVAELKQDQAGMRQEVVGKDENKCMNKQKCDATLKNIDAIRQAIARLEGQAQIPKQRAKKRVKKNKAKNLSRNVAAMAQANETLNECRTVALYNAPVSLPSVKDIMIITQLLNNLYNRGKSMSESDNTLRNIDIASGVDDVVSEPYERLNCHITKQKPGVKDLWLIHELPPTLYCTWLRLRQMTHNEKNLRTTDVYLFSPRATQKKLLMITYQQHKKLTINMTDLLIIRAIIQFTQYINKLFRPKREDGKVITCIINALERNTCIVSGVDGVLSEQYEQFNGHVTKQKPGVNDLRLIGKLPPTLYCTWLSMRQMTQNEKSLRTTDVCLYFAKPHMGTTVLKSDKPQIGTHIARSAKPHMGTHVARSVKPQIGTHVARSAKPQIGTHVARSTKPHMGISALVPSAKPHNWNKVVPDIKREDIYNGDIHIQSGPELDATSKEYIDDEDDGGLFGILGVYARSEMHGNYTESCVYKEEKRRQMNIIKEY